MTEQPTQPTEPKGTLSLENGAVTFEAKLPDWPALKGVSLEIKDGKIRSNADVSSLVTELVRFTETKADDNVWATVKLFLNNLKFKRSV